MKYVAILRTSRITGEFQCGPLTFVEKSEIYDKKSDAKKWLNDAIKNFNQKKDNVLSIQGKTIIAFSEKQSEEIEDFLDFTFN